jgi:ABC-2 type transport system permease protein
MRPALHAEWTKLRTIPGPRWLLLATIALTVALSAAVTAVTTGSCAACGKDPSRLALTGVDLGQAPVVILAVLLISGEYGTGTIQTTLTVLPRRTGVLAAKAVILTATVACTGAVATLGSLLAARLIASGRGFTAAHGHPAVAQAAGPALRAAFGSTLYLVLIGLLSLGVAAIVRDSAAGIGVVLAMLYLFPLLAQSISSPHWQRLLQQIGPMSAVLAIQASNDSPSPLLGPWTGLAVTAGWAATALLTGNLLLHTRDV